MSSRRLGRQKNVTLKTSSVRLHQDECLLGAYFVMTKLEGPGMQLTIVYFVNTSLEKKWYQKWTVRIVMHLFNIPRI